MNQTDRCECGGPKSMTMALRPINVRQAREFVSKHHYSKVMPRLTRMCVGGFRGDELFAVATFGYGVRPVHTLAKIFPSLTVPEYLEIGKLCVDDAMPKNTESAFMSRAFKMVKHHFPNVKIIYSWADGIVGKPGYVYQAANFFYGGYIWTEMYLSNDGTRVHPRTMQGLSETDNGNKFHSRDYATTTAMGFTKYWGLQFRYVYPVCHRQEWKRLAAESPIEWTRGGYPKDADCQWMIQVGLGDRMKCGIPPFVSGRYIRGNGEGVMTLPFTESIQ